MVSRYVGSRFELTCDSHDPWDGFTKRSGTLTISWLSFPIALGQRRSRSSTAAVRRWPAPSPLVGFLVALRWLPGGFPVRFSGRSGRPPGRTR